MKSGKRIILITPGFPASEVDTTCIPGLQVYVRALSRYHPEYEPVIITLQYPFTREAYRWYDVPVFPCGGRNRGGINRVLTWLHADKVFDELAMEKMPSLVHSFWLNEACLTGIAKSAEYEIPHVSSILGQDVLPANRYLRVLNLSRTMVVAPSGFSLEKLTVHTPLAHSTVIPLGIDLEELPAVTNSQRNIDILGVGALIAVKHYEVFVEVVARLKKNIPGINAVIAGDGPEKPHLSALIEQHGLQDNITLAGKRERPEVLEMMGRSRVLLHPSEIEGFGMVCAEALNMGMRVVSRRVGSVLKHPNWRFATTSDEFTAQTAASLNDIQPTSTEVFFDIRQCVKEYAELFERIMAK